jgi:hypothetical protein
MPALITSVAVEECLGVCLSREGYELSVVRGHCETAVDIEALIALSQLPLRLSDTAQAALHAPGTSSKRSPVLCRLNDGATRCALAVPTRSSEGLPTRANLETMYQTELDDCARSGKIRQAEEKRLRDPDDVFIHAEERRQELKKQRTKKRTGSKRKSKR